MFTYSNQLLLPYTHSCSPDWEKNDSQELFYNNLQIQPDNWYYRQNTVRYTWNSNGYRCPEWDNIHWSSSNILMGCSYAQGMGVDDADTISAQVSNGVNLAQSGTNVYTIQYNTLRLLDLGIRPKSVKIIVPDLARSVYWGSEDWVDLTPHDLEIRGHSLTPQVRDYYNSWLSIAPNAELQSYMTIRSVQALWSAAGVSCDLYHNWMLADSKFVTAPLLPEPIDQARNINHRGFAHPGRKTLQQWADFIYG